MFKKTLVASALVISTVGVFAQAPASPVTLAPVAATKTTEAAKAPSAAVAKPNADVQMTKHQTKKTKHVRVKSARAKKKMLGSAKPVTQDAPVKP